VSEYGDLDRIALARDGNHGRLKIELVVRDQAERRDGRHQRAMKLFRLRFQLGGGVAGIAQE
jgi:hypothetical protein